MTFDINNKVHMLYIYLMYLWEVPVQLHTKTELFGCQEADSADRGELSSASPSPVTLGPICRIPAGPGPLSTCPCRLPAPCDTACCPGCATGRSQVCSRALTTAAGAAALPPCCNWQRRGKGIKFLVCSLKTSKCRLRFYSDNVQ